MALHTLARQTIWYMVARLLSAGCSFLLFSLIARKLGDVQSQRAFFFMFALGFALATLKLFAQLAAAINGQARSTVRLRQAREGLRRVVRTLPFGVPLLGAILWVHTRSVPVVALSCLIACIAAVDVDLLRAVVHRGPSFPSTFAVGNMLALTVLALNPHPGLDAVCFCMLMQWLPACAFNALAFRRLSGKGTRSEGRGHAAHLVSLLLLAIFDGAILNTPFLGLFAPSPSTGVELSLGIRVFVASIAMQPMLLHWANSPALGKLVKRLKVSIALGFSLLLLVSGVIVGTVFIVLYIVVSGKPFTSTEFVIYLLLLASYSFYISQMRISALQLHAHLRFWVLAILLSIYILVFVLFAPGLRESAMGVGQLQAISLTTAALVLGILSRWKKGADPSST